MLAAGRGGYRKWLCTRSPITGQQNARMTHTDSDYGTLGLMTEGGCCKSSLVRFGLYLDIAEQSRSLRYTFRPHVRQYSNVRVIVRI
jgi:hypothetical protein